MKKIYLCITLFFLYSPSTLGMYSSSTSSKVRQTPSRELTHTHSNDTPCAACIEQDAQYVQTTFNPNQLPLLEAARLGYFCCIPQSREAFQAAGFDVNRAVEYKEDQTQAYLSNETGKKMYPVDAGKTLLHYAAQFNNAPVTHLLLRAGANPNCTSKNGITPLQTALFLHHTAVLKELFANPTVCAKLDTPDEEGNTLLHKATQAGKLNLVQILLERGANPSIQNHTGKTAAQETTSLPILSALQKAENSRIEKNTRMVEGFFQGTEGMDFTLSTDSKQKRPHPRPDSH